MIRAAALCLAATPALADGPVCLPLDQWRAALADYERAELVRGMFGPDLMLLIFVAPDGSFSMFTVTRDMNACLMANGENFMMVAPGVEG